MADTTIPAAAEARRAILELLEAEPDRRSPHSGIGPLWRDDDGRYDIVGEYLFVRLGLPWDDEFENEDVGTVLERVFGRYPAALERELRLAQDEADGEGDLESDDPNRPPRWGDVAAWLRELGWP